MNVNFPVIFFGRELPYRDGFRCAYHLNTLKKLKSPFVKDVVKIIIDLTEGSFNQTVSDTVASGGIEVIEKLYNAKFRMIGYKRYRE